MGNVLGSDFTVWFTKIYYYELKKTKTYLHDLTLVCDLKPIYRSSN